MSKLCKIESPISLRLMSLNFVRGRGENEEERRKEQTKESERRGRRSSARFFWGSLHNVRVGVSVTGCLRWGRGCGCPNVVRCITLDACVRTLASASPLYVCLIPRHQEAGARRVRACVCASVACVVQGAEGSSRCDCDRNAGRFLLGNWWRQRSCHTAAMAG